jgi:excisionase family DNA binding protein
MVVKHFMVDIPNPTGYTSLMLVYMTQETDVTNDTMSVTELAQYLGRKRRTVYEWVRGGYITAVRDGLAPNSPMRVERQEADRVKRLLDAGKPL